ncbi:MAG: hypothetical protein VB100_11075 [Angelakisella sp.]|nr:hypothetical protein [Angelakisella sp.]
MRRILSLILAFVLILTLGGCAVAPPTGKDSSGNTSSESRKSDKSNSLPDYFPKDLRLIPDYAEIVSVREKEGAKGVDVVLASDGSINGLRDHYEQVFGGGIVKIEDRDDGYYISAKKDGSLYTILISADTSEGHSLYNGKICVTVSILKGESDFVDSEGDAQKSDTASTSDKWPTHGAAANIPELGKYSELKVTDMNILGSDEFIIECKTSKEDLREYAESVMEKFPLKRTKIDEGRLYSVTGHDNKGLVFTAQHDSSTDAAKIQIYVDSFFDPENPDGTDENGVPNWVNK